MNDQTPKESTRSQHDPSELLLDEAVSAVLSAELSERDVAESTTAVWSRIRAEVAAESASVELRGCDDYQAAMPALVAGTLAEGRRILVEDHTRQCIPCRRALQAVRAGQPVASVSSRNAGSESGSQQPRASSSWRLGIAAGFVLALAAGWLAWSSWPVSQAESFQVRGFDHRVFEVSTDGLRPVQLGEWIDGRTEIRTAKGGARIELADGSLVEVAERTAFEVVQRRRGALIRVNRGSVIVEASEQGSGRLEVSTNELLASVKGTIFAVSHGTKGSRVSVIEGEVQVEQGRRKTALLPGEQIASRTTLSAAPLSREIGWSSNVDRYVAMLEEFRQLRQDLSQLMEAEPRYSTRLLDLAPAGTVVYIALPNPTSTVAGLYQLIRERVAANPQLFEWWQEVESSGHLAEIDAFVDEIQELSNFLGDETVVALDAVHDEEVHFPVVMSEVVDGPALRAALAAKLAEIRAEHPDFAVVLLDESTTMVNEAETDLFVWVGDDLLVAASEISEIHRINAGDTAGFEATAFRNRIAEAYAEGAEYLGAVDLATVFAQVMEHEAVEDPEAVQALEFSGFSDVQHLVVERSQDSDRAYTAADLSFSGPRTGLASWIAVPGPMGALDFFSPDTTFVGAFVTRDPGSVIDEIFAFAASQGEDVDLEAELAEAEGEIGFRIREDLIDTLGGESAAGIDGPALPTPSWKIVVEVYDSTRLQSTIETLVDRVNQEQTSATVTLSSSESAGRVFYRLEAEGGETLDLPFNAAGMSYAYVDGYLVAAPSQTLIERAIQYRDSGSSVVTSDGFQELLPTDGYVDFSAVVYNRIGEAVSSLAGALPLPADLTDDQRQLVDSLVSEVSETLGPSMYCLYGDDDRIRLVSNSPSMLPFAGLESVFGLGAVMSQFGELGGEAWQ